MATTDSTNFSKGVRRMLGLSLDTWNNIMLSSLGIAAVAAAIVGISTYAVVQLQKQDSLEAKIEFDAYKLTVDGQVSDARKEGIRAGETAGNAILRAAELEKDAANVRLETEKIKSVVAWRTISPDIASKLEAVLITRPGSVNLRYTDGDPEALFLAIQISRILAKSNWKIAPGSIKPTNGILFGITIPDSTEIDSKTLMEAFSAADLPHSHDQIPPSGVSFNISTIPGAPILMIGSRPPPQLP
jgi:hypothetical protein